jgi:hypothetical protein
MSQSRDGFEIDDVGRHFHPVFHSNQEIGTPGKKGRSLGLESEYPRCLLQALWFHIIKFGKTHRGLLEFLPSLYGRSIKVCDKVYQSVMPDLRSLPRASIRGHPDTPEKTGFRLEFIPMKIGAGMTFLI